MARKMFAIMFSFFPPNGLLKKKCITRDNTSDEITIRFSLNAE
jgi:hypothetical protein